MGRVQSVAYEAVGMYLIDRLTEKTRILHATGNSDVPVQLAGHWQGPSDVLPLELSTVMNFAFTVCLYT